MGPVPEEFISYTDALFRLNDLCGKRVAARVCDPDNVFLWVEGTLAHVELWGCYRVDEARLDVTGFQECDQHWSSKSGGAVHFYDKTRDLRVEVVALGEGDAGS
jgi:hypothetical protein